MQQLKASIDELDKKINEETQVALQSIEGTYRATVQQEANLAAKLEGAKKAVLDLQDRSIRFNILKREVDTNRQLYDGLLQRLKEVGVEAGVGTNNVTVVDSALPPGAPYKPNLMQNLQIAAALGLVLGLGLAFFLEYLDDTLRHPEDMERLTHLPVLGVIPRIKAKKGRGGGGHRHDGARRPALGVSRKPTDRCARRCSSRRAKARRSRSSSPARRRRRASRRPRSRWRSTSRRPGGRCC